MSSPATASPPNVVRGLEDEARTIAALAQQASVETTWHDRDRFDACSRHLARGTPMYVSFIPGQTWERTLSTCVAVRAAGLEPVPHVPVRELRGQAALEHLAAELVDRANVGRVLLIAGDRAKPLGPYAQSLDVLRNGVLARYHIRQVVVAGHPEGHPSVSISELRRAEREKLRFAAEAGIELSFLTQFFFDHAPFLAWVRELRAHGVRARIVAGLAGPARLATLFKYALRCGVGASIRALGARPSSVAVLVGERGPESIVRAIARARREPGIEPVGIHLYSFGGLERTCAWIGAVARCRFALDDQGGFVVEER
ncbi:MAG TPA: methylenetetrahydrofolate reductase [Casimicrobiaceae bacterium]|nr:methylenetetrahydrofolate reductase [Casimicrobiaceae bacterium]